MTLNETIIQAVTPVVPVCVPDLYKTAPGETPAPIYCTFNFSLLPDAVGDDRAHLMRALCQVHLFTPLKASTVALRRRLWSALAAVEDFTLPEIANVTDEYGQHYVYEFDAAAEWVDG